MPAGVSPQVRAVGAVVVGQDPLNRDAAGGEPLNSAVQDRSGGEGVFVVVAFGGRRRGSGRRENARPTFGLCHLLRGLPGVAALLRLTDVAPPAAIWDVPELLHVDVHEQPRVVVHVSADRLARSSIGIRQVVEAC